MRILQEDLSIVVVGASGDLARKKILPALFALYCQGYLPATFQIFGFARSDLSDAAFRQSVADHLTCRYVPGESCRDRMDAFLARCHYCRGSYASPDAYLDLFQRMQALEASKATNRLFYLAIPPSIFLDVARAVGDAGLVQCGTGSPWSRVVIEKPFGRDRDSSDVLTRELAKVFTEDQTYRIDHYLGKDVVQNLMVLRFANSVFEPVWNRRHVEAVTINWQEDVGLEGRAGYFDHYGIIRDVVQNHMLQILALIAMERPLSTLARDVRDEKVRVLKAIPPLGLNDCVVGQYTAGQGAHAGHPGYREEAGISGESRTPTFACARLRIENDRWRGVPFTIRAGKALACRCNEVRIRFRPAEGDTFRGLAANLPRNELVIRVQPDPAIYFNIVNKHPGLDPSLVESRLDLVYEEAFQAEIPDAYECLLLDVMQGDKSLFIRADELAAAWDVFTPVLHALEETDVEPRPYAFGSDGPEGACAGGGQSQG